MRFLLAGCYLNCSFRQPDSPSVEPPFPGWISIHFQVQQRNSIDFFSLYDLRYLVVFFLGFFFPPRKNFILLTPYGHLSQAVKKNAVVSCSGLREGAIPRTQIPASRSTCLIFLAASAVKKHLLDVLQARLLPADRNEKIHICNFYANQENVCLFFLYWWCYFIMMNNKNVNGNVDLLTFILLKKKHSYIIEE